MAIASRASPARRSAAKVAFLASSACFAPFLGHVVREPPSVLGDSAGAVFGLTDGLGSLGFHSLDLRLSLTEHSLHLLPV
jgi:hypothetical protein